MPGPILDAQKVTTTLSTLRQRIGERFPDSGLYHICEQLEAIAEQTSRRAELIAKPILWVRVLTWLAVIVISILGMILPFVLKLGFNQEELTFKDFVELGDPVLNEIVLIAAALFFLLTLEKRIKRNRALKAVHELRSIAHVIDMHQLTKDPERVLNDGYERTNISPDERLTRFQLRRYLDYCTEMLSLTGKLAALYVQDFDDEVALASVNEVESLTTGLSRKIWQKIMILIPSPRAGDAVSNPAGRSPEAFLDSNKPAAAAGNTKTTGAASTAGDDSGDTKTPDS